jgi:hypothetical protein
VSDLYILDGHTPVSEPDLMTWGRWFEKADRHVCRTEVGDVKVSTVFLGIDHAFGGFGDKPVLFETMVFGGPHDQWQDRCSTWDEAVVMHQKALDLVASAPTGEGHE